MNSNSTIITIIMFVFLGLLLLQQKLKSRKTYPVQNPDIETPSSAKFSDGILFIATVNNTQFELVNVAKESLDRIKWSDISSLSFNDQNDMELVLERQKVKIPLETVNYFHLIRNIPTNIPNFESAKAKVIYDSLQPCEICAMIAVYQELCQCCHTRPYQFSQASNKMSQQEYLREMQLVYFRNLETGKTIEDFITETSEWYDRNVNWKPYVSERLILESRKKR